jgi:hypothetical protein
VGTDQVLVMGAAVQSRTGSLHGVLHALRGWLRLTGFTSAIAVLGAALVVRSAQARLGESALALGRRLSGFEQISVGAQQVLINGESIHLASRTTELAIDALLGRFDTMCRRASSELLQQFGAAAPESALTDSAPRAGSSSSVLARRYLPILHRRHDDEGVVACLVLGLSQLAEPLLQRLQRLARTGDLGYVGELRYLYARRQPTGRTHVLIAWTTGRFRLGALVPSASGDSLGTDLSDAPRPRESVRLLSAEIAGQPHALRVYDSPRAPQSTIAEHDRVLRRLGWQPVGLSAAQAPPARAYSKADADLLVFAFGAATGSHVSLLRTRSQ